MFISAGENISQVLNFKDKRIFIFAFNNQQLKWI